MDTYTSRGYERRPARVQWFARLPRFAQNLLVGSVLIGAFVLVAWIDQPIEPTPAPVINPYTYDLHPEYRR
jgi:hypothetical protein